VHVSDSLPQLPDFETADPPDLEDAADVASRDSEIDFDDERSDDQLPLDEVEAIESGTVLDDPEELAEDEDEDEDD
jgi:hypothetical protein